ncbi:MAG: hypothetical protein ACJ780_20905, partial [Solirubrobacteraceae bacterium]
MPRRHPLLAHYFGNHFTPAGRFVIRRKLKRPNLARPVALHDQDVTVAFPAGKAFLKRKAEQDDYRRATAEALRAICGVTFVLRYELRDEEELPDPANGGALSHEELVKRLVDEFDAQEVLDDDEETK